MKSPLTLWCQMQIATAALVLLALSSETKAQEARVKLADLCPSDVLVYATFAGAEACSNEALGLGYYKLWSEPAVQTFLSGVLKRAFTNEPFPESTQQMVSLGRKFLSGRVEMAVSMTPMTVMWERNGPIPIPSAILALDLGDHVAEAHGLVEKMIDSNQGDIERSGVTVTREKMGQSDITVFNAQSRHGPRLKGYLAFRQNLLLVGVGPKFFEQCLSGSAHKDNTVIARNASYRGCRGRVEGHPLLEVWVNTQSLTHRVRSFLPEEWLTALDLSGLSAVRGVYLASGVKAGQGEDVIAIDAPGKRQGVLGANDGVPLSADLLKVFPENTVFMTAMRTPLRGIYDASLRTAFEVVPAYERTAIERMIEKASSFLGMKLRDEILEALGDEVAIGVELGDLLPKPTAYGLWKVRDEAKVLTLLGTVAKKAGMALKATEYRGVQIMSLTRRNAQDGEGESANGTESLGQSMNLTVKPSFALTNGYLVIGLDTAATQSIIRSIQKPPTKSMVASENFLAVAPGMGLEQAAYVHYIDFRRLFEKSIGFVSLLTMVAGPQLEKFGIDLDQLPDTDTLLQHVHSWIGTGSGDEHGWVIRMRGVGVSSLLSIAGRLAMNLNSMPNLELFAGNQRSRGVRIAVPAHPGQGDAPPGSESGRAPNSPRQTAINPLKEGAPEEKALRQQLEKIDQRIAEDPEEAGLYLERGLVRHQLRDFQGSISDHVKARQLGSPRVATAAYNIACAYALLGKNDHSLQWLNAALKEGFDDWNLMSTDSDLEAIRSLPEFKKLVQSRPR